MNILSAIGRGLTFVGQKAKEAVKKVGEIAKTELSGELARVREAGVLVRQAVSDASDRARDAAADAIAKSAAGIGIKAAERVATEDHWTRRASAFLDIDPEKRKWLLWGGVILAIFLIFVIARKTGGR